MSGQTKTSLLPAVEGIIVGVANQVVVHGRNGRVDFELDLDDGPMMVRRLAAFLDNGNVGDEGHGEAVGQLAMVLAKEGMLDVAAPEGLSGRSALLSLEESADRMLRETLYRNSFWHNVMDQDRRVPLPVLYGMCIENWQFLFRESLFDAPALVFPASTPARVAMNRFFAEEFGHDELLLIALETIGISRDNLLESLPLPETMALCNALGWWSRTDPLFFFATVGVLEGRDMEIDSYVLACERHGLDEAFVSPIRTHSRINVDSHHGSLSRELFAHLPFIDKATLDRMHAQMRLFVELYDDFYEAIWNHYSEGPLVLRCLSKLWGG